MPTDPAKKPFPVLIHGGSTATGMWGIQFAKASGLTVVATASPHNFDYLKWLGADAVFDYRSPTCGTDIRAFTKNKLRHAWDCAGGGEVICGEALSDAEPSKYGGLNASNPTNADILKNANPLVDGSFFVLAYNVLNEPYEWRNAMIQPPVDQMEFAQMFKEVARDLLDKGHLKFINISLNKGGSGLEGILKGLDEMRMGKVSGQKLVYTL
ncbi:putative alcohol dehydrogenase [Ilyonectria robusta]